MAIEKLVDSLIADSNAEAEKIIASANEEAKRILELNENKINEMSSENEMKAKEAGEIAKATLIQGTKLKVRNDILAAKQSKIEEVFSICVETLEKMSDEEFISFFKENIKSLDLTGEVEVIVNEKRHDLLTSKILKEATKKEEEKFRILDLIKKDEVKYVLCLNPEPIKDGFMLKQGDIYYNFTFEAVVSARKVDLIKEVAANLF